ncbi:MAG: hypothetical protein KF799_09990 [Bdellovibrionales bacterium]|nr:hypothetical protein [Bdellovibrionales bacterium]
MKFFILFISILFSFAALGESGLRAEVKKVRYQIYKETCEGVNCRRTPIKSGQVTIKLEAENENYSWGITTENLKDQKIEYKLIISISVENQKKYRLQSSILRSESGQKAAFSSAAIVMSGYTPGLELILEPSEGAGSQTRASLILE